MVLMRGCICSWGVKNPGLLFCDGGWLIVIVLANLVAPNQ